MLARIQYAMKRMWIAVSTALVVGFAGAVGTCVRALFQTKSVAASEANGMTVVVDAGHGGVDGGVTGRNTGVKESDLNLSISFRLKSALEDMGFSVVMTRKTQSGLYGAATNGFKKRDMQKRKSIIEAVKPTLVISVHQNYYSSRSTRGGQVFYRASDEPSRSFAASLQDELNALYKTENVRERTEMAGDYFMLSCASCPSVIVECGFLSNAEDERLLASATWQQRLAQSIADGTLAYFAAAGA